LNRLSLLFFSCEFARQQISLRDVVELDKERKAPMVCNLLVVLCGDRTTQLDRSLRAPSERAENPR